MTSPNAKIRQRSPRLPVAKREMHSPAKRELPKKEFGAFALVHRPTAGEANRTSSPASQEESLASALVRPATPAQPGKLGTERTITVKEAAFRLGKSADTIHFWLRTGRLRGWQPGGRGCGVMVAETSVEEALLCCSKITRNLSGARG